MKFTKFFIIFLFVLAFVFQVSAQETLYLNDSKVYLTLKEKLKNLKLLISTEKDVKKIFGKNCRNSCFYQNWLLNFKYVDENFDEIITDGNRNIYKPNPQLIGKLSNIGIIYDERETLRKPFDISILSCIKTVTYSYKAYNSYTCLDKDGLSYLIFDEINIAGVNYKNLLISISFELSEDKYKEIFILNKQ